MDLFIIDTEKDEALLTKKPTTNLVENILDGYKNSIDDEEIGTEEEDDKEENTDFVGFISTKVNISNILNKYKTNEKKKCSSKNDLDEFVRDMGWKDENVCMASIKKNKKSTISKEILDKSENKLIRTNVDAELQNSVLNGIEKAHDVKSLSDRKLVKERKKERAKTKGKDWYHMPATEITEELENDLKILQMRSVLDPKHFYKKNDLKVLPKYFQVGTFLHSPLDHFNDRNIRKNKKTTLVDELLADAEFQRYNKRKFNEVMEKKRRTGYHKAHKKMKKLKKNK